MNPLLRILVLENQRIDAELMTAELKAGGLLFDWRRVDTEEAFIEELATPPDLILADYYLPGYSALEALAYLHKNELDIPFIIVSGVIDEEKALETITLGATDYLAKGHLGRLGFAVKRALAERGCRDRHRTLQNPEQKGLQGELQEALRTYESIIEASPAAIFAVAPDGSIQAWNRSAERVFGWTTSEVMGKPNPIVPPEKQEEFREFMRQSMEGLAVFQKEVERRHKDGRKIDISLSTAPLRDEHGEIYGVMAVVFDITERKRAEEKLHRFTDIIEATSDFVGISDAEGRSEYINVAGRRLAGLPTEGELNDLRISELHPAWAAERILHQAIPAAVDAGTWSGETALRTRGGKEIPVSQVLIAHRRADGTLSHLSTIMRDISEQKRNEAELVRLNRTLRVLSHCNEILVRARSEQDLVNRILHVLVESGYPVALVWLKGSDDGEFRPTIHPEKGREFFDSMTSQGCRLTGDVARICRERSSREIPLREELLACGRCTDCRALAESLDLRSAFSLYLGTRDAHIGCLVLFSREEGFITEEIPLLKELADDLAFGIGSLRTEAAHQESQEVLRLRNRAIEASNNGIMISEAKLPESPIIYVNPAFEEITGYSAAEMLGLSPQLLSGRDQKQPGLVEIRAYLEAGRAGKALVRNYRKDGELFWNDLSVAPVRDAAGRLTHFVSFINDVTDRKRYEEELEHHSNFDHLTGLANRNLLSDRIRQGIAHARRTGRKMAILLLDLDRFQIINDSLGHSFGNELLKLVAERFEVELRSQDTLARIGGDEFVILLQEVDTAEDVVRTLEKFRATLLQAFTVGERSLRITASTGISLYPDDGEEEETLIRNADIAMYHSKATGPDTFHFFTAEMDARIVETMDLEADLRHAVEREELILHFQPKIDVASGEIVGSEALVRWQHPQRGMVSPGAFIPLAEETGLIEPIGEWVLREACRRNKAFQEEGLSAITVSVNISARQFRNKGLAGMVADILAETGMEARWLDLELTESMIMDRPEQAAAMMGRLKDTGIALSLDDFGTGYSSLNYLRRFPVDSLKIDRSFIADVDTDPGSASVANSIIDIAHNLGMEAVAEGVETGEQLEFLRRCGCDTFQGFLFSRPVPSEEFGELLRKKGIS